MYTGPRAAERIAAAMASAAPSQNEIRKEGRNAWTSVLGNQSIPVRTAKICGEMELTSAGGREVRMAWTGLNPRNAANIALVGGIALMAGMS